MGRDLRLQPHHVSLGVILFQFGSGPVKGFAVTLCVGIVTSLFTAVFATRTVYEYRLAGRRLDHISV